VDIAAWLRELGLERYEAAFRKNDIALGRTRTTPSEPCAPA
jgi:hypothetical protein